MKGEGYSSQVSIRPCNLFMTTDLHSTSVGDQQGLGLVVDICKPHREFRGNHFMVPQAVAMSSLLPEDLAALNAKGCFSLPSVEIREGLLQCYFRYVHPFLPILDVGSFLHQYESGGPRKVNLLLLWAMFFASTNVSSSTVVDGLER